VQDEGSQLVAECVDAAPGMLVVDACAGAGGKSLALASAMEGRGRIVACDVRQRVLDRGLGRSSRARYSCVETVSLPDEGPLPERLLALRGKADRVLVDAPCSGSGSIRRTPHGRWRATERELAELPPRQLAILARTAPLVAPGGRLVYATCSLFRAENEDVVARFLSSEPSFSLLPLDAVLGAPRAASFGDGKFLKLFPHIHDTDGFFAAVLSKA
jgi:16S rRNA (cytosine967-C5)-methyltransferase